MWARQAIKALGDCRLALVCCVRRQPGRQSSGDDAGLGYAFLGGQLVQALGVLRLDEQVEAVVAHSSIPSLGSREASRAVRCMDGSSRSEEHTSELQSLMRISYAVFCLKKKKTHDKNNT